MANKQSKRDRREAARRAAQRRQRQKWIGLGTAFVMAVTALVVISRPGDSGDQAAALAPDFELESATGDTVKLSDYRGQPVALIFMHTY